MTRSADQCDRPPPPLVIVAAMSRNRLIGRGGRLPWHLPDDLAHFQRITTGKHLLVGRKTFESLPGPLPGRTIVVLTRRPDYTRPDVLVAHDFEQAIALCRSRSTQPIIIAGGSRLYAQALPRADRMVLTIVHAHLEGDCFFPPFDPRPWHLLDQQHHPADDRHAYPFTIQTWQRRR